MLISRYKCVRSYRKCHTPTIGEWGYIIFIAVLYYRLCIVKRHKHMCFHNFLFFFVSISILLPHVNKSTTHHSICSKFKFVVCRIEWKSGAGRRSLKEFFLNAFLMQMSNYIRKCFTKNMKIETNNLVANVVDVTIS